MTARALKISFVLFFTNFAKNLEIMWQSLIDYLVRNWAIPTWTLIIILVIYLTYKITIKIQKLIEKTDKVPEIQSKIDNLPCNEHDTELVSAKNKLAELDNSYCDIKWWIAKLDPEMIPVFLPKRSPRYISEAGNALLDKTCGRETIDENIDFFISEVEKYKPQTAYDVEEISLKIVLENSNKEIFNCIKNYVYFQPEVMEFAGIKAKYDLFVIIRVMSVYLRDKYLEKYPELLEDIEFEED